MLWKAEQKIAIYRSMCSAIKKKNCCEERECAWEGSSMSRRMCKSRKFTKTDICKPTIGREFQKYISDRIKSYNTKTDGMTWMYGFSQIIYDDIFASILAKANYTQECKKVIRYWMGTAGQKRGYGKFTIRPHLYKESSEHHEKAFAYFKTMYECAHVIDIGQTLLFRGNDEEFEFEDIEKLTATSLSVSVLGYYNKGNAVFIYVPNKRVFGLAIDNFNEHSKGNNLDCEILLINPVVKEIQDVESNSQLAHELTTLQNYYKVRLGFEVDKISVYEYLGFYTDDQLSISSSTSYVKGFSFDNLSDVDFILGDEFVYAHGFL